MDNVFRGLAGIRGTVRIPLARDAFCLGLRTLGLGVETSTFTQPAVGRWTFGLWTIDFDL